MVRRLIRLPVRIVRRLRPRPDAAAPSVAQPVPDPPAVGSAVSLIALSTARSDLLRFRLPAALGPVAISSLAGSSTSPLAAALAGIPGVVTVFGVEDTLALRVAATADTAQVEHSVARVLSAHLQ